MALARNFKATVSKANQIALNWLVPLNFNNENDELIITRSISHYPMELYNESFPNRATDSRPVEVYRGRTIVGTNTGTISVTGNTITDTSASFPTTIPLNGRLLRDSLSKVHRIVSNTTTTVTLETTPTNGKYVILPDFPETSRIQENYELALDTVVGSGYITNLSIVDNGVLTKKLFQQDELVNMIFKDGNGDKFIVKSNTESTVYFFETDIPLLAVGMATLNSFYDSQPLPYMDSYKSSTEAQARVGTGLEDNRFYYYTLFTNTVNANVAQAEFATTDSNVSTQTFSISPKDRNFGELLYNLWPGFYREIDESEDLQDLMNVFGHQFNELHALISSYNLQDSDNLLVTAALPLSEQLGLESVGYSIGADTFRRIARDMLTAWKLKGSKEGIGLFIRILTTWDITNGTGDYSTAIQDFLPNVSALRFFDPNLSSINVRLTKTEPFIAGGRFAKTLPGIVIPGFFTFREFVIAIPSVALFVGDSEGFTVSSGTTTMTDTSEYYGATDSLKGNYLIPNTEEVNDIFEIVSNTANTITVKGSINNRVAGGSYAILSPLNTNRFIILNKLLPSYIPFGTKAGFLFIT